MYRLLAAATLFVYTSNAGLVKVPKIYNALISSDDNLSPSQSFPILEPVLRTTALGVAFPPIVVHPRVYSNEQIPKTDENHNKKVELPANVQQAANVHVRQNPLLSYHGTLYPLTHDSYVLPYGYHHGFLYPALPYYQHPVYADVGQYQDRKPQERDTRNSPNNNFVKNPEVSEIQLPNKDERKRNS